MDMSEAVKIRAMQPEDLEAIVQIDTKVLGCQRRDYWLMKLELSEKRSPIASLVAEIEGKVIGFIIGDASGWEYGVPNTVGWIDTIGVDPDNQRQGIATLLFREMVAHLRKVGVNTIYTLVNWRQGDLLRFFEKMGFSSGEMINLQLGID